MVVSCDLCRVRLSAGRVVVVRVRGVVLVRLAENENLI
jgi:hypothetical protein